MEAPFNSGLSTDALFLNSLITFAGDFHFLQKI